MEQYESTLSKQRDIRHKNSMINKQNQDMETKIMAKRKEHHATFQETLKTITQRVDQHQDNKNERKQIENLKNEIIKEKDEIEKLNEQIDGVEKTIKDVYTAYQDHMKL